MKLLIEEIAKSCNAKILQKGLINEVEGISIDTRTMESKTLFVALKGESFDGHDFIGAACEKGAAAIIFEINRNLDLSRLKDIYIIEVNDTLKALKDISKFYRDQFNIPFIGVTGSTGKTTTKDMVSSVLSYKKQVLKNAGNFNNQIGLPLTLFKLEERHEAAVLEMGMSSFGEIEALVEIVQPQVAVITNIGMSHIEHLGSKENILAAKLEIASKMRVGDYLLLNGDDDYLSKLRGEPSVYSKIYFGLQKENDVVAGNVINHGEEGFSFDVLIQGEKQAYRLSYPGIHNVYNALAAIWIGRHFGMSQEDIQKALDQFEPSKMRMEIVKLEDIKVINDAYNASPDSMRAALGVLNSFTAGRRIAVLGNIYEMGDFAEEGHRAVGSCFASTGVEVLITVGEMAKWIAEEAIDKKTRKELHILNNNQEAISTLNKILQPGDTILVKGSRGMKMEEIVKYLQERS